MAFLIYIDEPKKLKEKYNLTMKVKHLLLILIILMVPFCHFVKKLHTSESLNDKSKMVVEIIKDSSQASRLKEVIPTLDSNELKAVVNWMDMHSGDFIPLYYIAMADYVLEIDKDKAVFWYFIGRLRSTVDVFMCADESARAQIGVYPMFAQKTLAQASSDLNQLRAVLIKAMVWDMFHLKKQSPKWSCYHGIQAMFLEPELVSKKEQIKRSLSLKKDFWKSIFKNRN